MKPELLALLLLLLRECLVLSVKVLYSASLWEVLRLVVLGSNLVVSDWASVIVAVIVEVVEVLDESNTLLLRLFI